MERGLDALEPGPVRATDARSRFSQCEGTVMRQRKQEHGFTLIELLVVIGIIAVLAAILFEGQ
jgi:prepilin-type N-terminal cleavage/methylation domain-containing protein